MITQLSDQIWARREFQDDYVELLVAARQREWNMPERLQEESCHADCLARLLQAATNFAASKNPVHRQAAYRIAISSWFITGGPTSTLRDMVGLVLNRIGNIPALDFLREQTRDSSPGVCYPLPLWLENATRENDNTVALEAACSLHLTDFQTELWRALESGNTVIVNAPTSAGKSFALQQYLVEMVYRGSAQISVYLVPSRALITQVSDSFRRFVSTRGIPGVVIATIPQTPEELAAERVIYVLTQERLQMLIDRLATFQANFIVVDEAQMVADGARGIVLQTAVERLRHNSPDARLLFGSPSASNPEVFGALFRLIDPRIIKAEESPVAQDLILMELDGNEPTLGTLFLRVGATRHHIGTHLFGSTLDTPEHILTEVTRQFGRGQQSLVYVGSADRCERVAVGLMDLERQQPASPGASEIQIRERADLAAFLRAHFHRDYELAIAVEQGIAFHYGGMPSTIRQAIESMFDAGALHTIVCTSTLLHGVNLPARNLFLYDPTKSDKAWSKRSESLSSSEFWNLAGRAGRLKREFSGNVFIIAPDKWRKRPYEGNSLQEVKPALAEQITKHLDALLDFINDRDRASGIKGEEALENAFMRLVNDKRGGRLGETLGLLPDDEAESSGAVLLPALDHACAGLTVPIEVAEANPNVSIYRQQEMLVLLIAGITEGRLSDFLPMHPMQSDSWQPLASILQRIHLVFLKKKNQSHRKIATVAQQWMQGRSYAEFIKYEWDNRKGNAEGETQLPKSRGPTPRLATAIRKVFNMIETDLRFTYVKYTKCYMDLLKHCLILAGHREIAERLIPIPLYLTRHSRNQRDDLSAKSTKGTKKTPGIVPSGVGLRRRDTPTVKVANPHRFARDLTGEGLELGASSMTMVNLIGLGLSRVCASLVSDVAPTSNMSRGDLLDWLRSTNLATRGLSPVVLREIAPLVPGVDS